jgi:hypothetical protein
MSETANGDTWSIGRSEHEGRILYIRINTGLKNIAGKTPFDHRFGVAVPLHSPGEDGLPTTVEYEELGRIEDELVATFEPCQVALLALVLTTSGFREFVFYTKAASDVEPLIEALKAQITTHKLQFYIHPDVDWDVYQSFLF